MAGGVVILGLGLRRSATVAEAEALLRQLAVSPDTCLAVPLFRSLHPVIIALQRRGHRLIALHPAQLSGVVTPSQSARILGLYGTGCMAEACALCAGGPGAQLIRTRILSPEGRITAALAQRPAGAPL